MNRQFRCGLTEPHFSLTAQNPDFSSESSLFGVFCLYSSCSAHACCACFTVESACFLPNCRSIEKQHRRSAVLSWFCAVSQKFVNREDTPTDMSNIIIPIITGIVCLAVGVIIGFLYRKSVAERDRLCRDRGHPHHQRSDQGRRDQNANPYSRQRTKSTSSASKPTAS